LTLSHAQASSGSQSLLEREMQLDLTDEEAAALLRELNNIIENDRYPLSPWIRMLRGIRAKLPGALRNRHRRDRRHPMSATLAAACARGADHGEPTDRVDMPSPQGYPAPAWAMVARSAAVILASRSRRMAIVAWS